MENEKLTDAKALEFDENETEENVTDDNDVEFGETAKNDRWQRPGPKTIDIIFPTASPKW